MRIVHASYARGLVRGGERQLVLLVEALARMGVEQQVLCRRGSSLHEELSKITGIGLVPAHHHLLDWLRPAPGDILHAHEARAAYWAGLHGILARKPYVITRRVLNSLSGNILTKQTYCTADAVVGVSQAVCDLIKRECGREGICIHDAHQSMEPDPDQVRAIRNRIGGAPVIGQVAALVDHRKGQSAAIAAFRLIRRRFPDARLVFVGEGPDRRMLEAKADGTDDIIFAGYQNDVADWTRALDVVVYPSAKDALASSLLDAMHLGVPVVANRVGGIPEIARHEETALLVERGDIDGLAQAVIRLLEETALHRHIVASARQLSARLSTDAMASSYLRLYECILEKRGQAGVARASVPR